MPLTEIPESALAHLLEAARAAQHRAHAPYSHFPVGAAVLDEQGRVHAGCNVENAAYPLGTCAEAGAIAAMVLAGGLRVSAMAVVGNGPNPVTPCGGCRQRLREFASPETPVVVGDQDRVLARHTLAGLLPASFGPGNLET
jgi:cytidine deaminase